VCVARSRPFPCAAGGVEGAESCVRGRRGGPLRRLPVYG